METSNNHKDDAQQQQQQQQLQLQPPPSHRDDNTTTNNNPMLSGAAAAAAGLRHRNTHQHPDDEMSGAVGDDTASSAARHHHQLEEPLIMLRRDSREDTTISALRPQQREDPLLLQQQSQSPQHRRERTVTNIAEVYRLVWDRAQSVTRTVAAREHDEHDDGDDGNDDTMHYSSTAAPSATAVAAAARAGAVANLCSATLGAGVLALPFALREAGLAVGGLLLAAAALATVASVSLLVRAADHYGCRTYEALAERAIGPRCRATVEGALLLFCTGCAVAYAIAVGDILVQADLLLWDSRPWSTIAAFTACMLPLSLLRTMRSLQFASSVGIAAIGTLALAALVHCVAAHRRGDGRNDNDSDGDQSAVHLRDFLWPAEGVVSVMTAAPVVLFAFSCQTNVCAIYEELVVPDADVDATAAARSSAVLTKATLMRQVTVTAVLLCALLYSTVSTIALADFGAAVLPNMLSNYHGDSSGQIMQVATAAMAFAVVMAFPLNIFPARVTLIGLIEKQQRQRRTLANAIQPADEENLTEALLSSSSNDENGAVVPAADVGVGAAATAETAANRESEQQQQHGHDMMTPLQMQQEPGTIYPSTEDGSIRPDNNVDDEDEHFNWQLHVATTLFLTGMALGFALVLPNISVVFGLLGGTASSMIGFVVPGLLGIQLCRDVRAETGERQLATWAVSWLLLAGGVLAGIVTTGVTAYNIFWAPSS